MPNKSPSLSPSRCTWLCVVFTPFIWSMNALGNGILRLLHLPPPEEGQGAYSVEELHLLIVQSHKAGILEDIERQLMQRSVQFADLRVTDVMIPRVDIVALDIALPEDNCWTGWRKPFIPACQRMKEPWTT